MKVSRCEYCGEDLDAPVDRWPGDPIVCHKEECVRWAIDEDRAARDEAHEQLDRDLGWA